MSAVSLDDKACALAEKVDDVGSEGLLPSKFGALHAAVAQQFPQGLLRGGCRSTKGACTVGRGSE